MSTQKGKGNIGGVFGPGQNGTLLQITTYGAIEEEERARDQKRFYNIYSVRGPHPTCRTGPFFLAEEGLFWSALRGMGEFGAGGIVREPIPSDTYIRSGSC